MDFEDPTHFLWALAAFFAALAGFSAWRDHVRGRRRDVDRPGWVPWQPIMILAMLLAAVSAALAIRA